MGRSVATPTNAHTTVFLHVEFSDDPFEWDDLVADIAGILIDRFPSFEHKSEYVDRECRCILENRYAQVVVSEYCGCVSITLRPDPRADGIEQLAEGWCDRIAANFTAILHKAFPTAAMVHYGTMSNGVSVYRAINS